MATAREIIASTKLRVTEEESTAIRSFEEAWSRILMADLLGKPAEALTALRDQMLEGILEGLRTVVQLEAKAQADLLGGPVSGKQAAKGARRQIEVYWAHFIANTARAGETLMIRIGQIVREAEVVGLSKDATRERLIQDREEGGRVFGWYRNEWRAEIMGLFRKIASAVMVASAEEVAKEGAAA